MKNLIILGLALFVVTFGILCFPIAVFLIDNGKGHSWLFFPYIVCCIIAFRTTFYPTLQYWIKYFEDKLK